MNPRHPEPQGEGHGQHLVTTASRELAREQLSGDSGRLESEIAFADDDSASRVAALSVRPNVRVIDLVRALEAAAFAGELHAVRQLAEAAVRALEHDEAPQRKRGAT